MLARLFYATALLAPLAGFAACEEPDAAAWEGELLTVTSSDGVELCGGTLAFLDRFVGHTYEYWTGETPPEEFSLEFDLRASNGSSRRGGAHAYDGYAWTSDQAALVHELTHIVVGWDDGRSAPSLNEGVAEALGPGDPVALWTPSPPHPREYAFLPADDFLYPDGELSARFYGPSAQLVRFLVERYGVTTLRSAYREARHGQTSEEIESAFVAAFGDDLYDTFDDFVIAPQCALQAWECSDAVVPLRELPVIVERVGDCTDDTAVVGATANGSELWFPVHQFNVELTADTDVVIDTSDNAILERMFCLDSCDADVPPNVLEWLGGSVDDTTWPEGRVTIRIWPDDPGEPFSASIRVAD